MLPALCFYVYICTADCINTPAILFAGVSPLFKKSKSVRNENREDPSVESIRVKLKGGLNKITKITNLKC